MVKMHKNFRAEWNMTSSQASDYLGIHVNTLRRWSDQGMVNCVTLGTAGHRRYRKIDLDRILIPQNRLD